LSSQTSKFVMERFNVGATDNDPQRLEFFRDRYEKNIVGLGGSAY